MWYKLWPSGYGYLKGGVSVGRKPQKWYWYRVSGIFEGWKITSDMVKARTEKEAKAKIRKYYKRKITGVSAQLEKEVSRCSITS